MSLALNLCENPALLRRDLLGRKKMRRRMNRGNRRLMLKAQSQRWITRWTRLPPGLITIQARRNFQPPGGRFLDRGLGDADARFASTILAGIGRRCFRRLRRRRRGCSAYAYFCVGQPARWGAGATLILVFIFRPATANLTTKRTGHEITKLVIRKSEPGG